MSNNENLQQAIENVVMIINKLQNYKLIENQQLEECQLIQSIQENQIDKHSHFSSDLTFSQPSILIIQLQDYMESIKKDVAELQRLNANCKCHQIQKQENAKERKTINRNLFIKSENTYDKHCNSILNYINVKQMIVETKMILIQEQDQLKQILKGLTQNFEGNNFLDISQNSMKIQLLEQNHEKLKGDLIELKQIQDLYQKILDLEQMIKESKKLIKK